MGHEDMLSATKLKEVAQRQRVTIEDLARGIVRGGLDLQDAISAIRNWERGLMRPLPKTEDVQKLADTLSVEVTEISDWHSSYMYAPMSARKVRLVMTLIRGRRGAGSDRRAEVHAQARRADGQPGAQGRDGGCG